MVDIRVNLTPLSQMNTEHFARRMTGAESLNDDQKKQIREQQEVCLQHFFVNVRFPKLNVRSLSAVCDGVASKGLRY